MASLSIRRLDDQIYALLRQRAKSHVVSLEEEVRQILTDSVTTPKPITEIFAEHFGQQNGIDVVIAENRQPHEPIDLT